MQTDSTDFTENNVDHVEENSRRISIIEPEKSVIKHLPTQATFTEGLAGPSFTKRFDTKTTKGAPLSKVKTTKLQAFNFNHPSSTLNFTSSYDVITPTSRAPINFRLFNLSKSGFSGSAKGFKIPSFVFVFVQK